MKKKSTSDEDRIVRKAAHELPRPDPQRLIELANMPANTIDFSDIPRVLPEEFAQFKRPRGRDRKRTG